MLKITIDSSVGKVKLQRLQAAVTDRTILDVVKLRLLAWVDQNFRDAGTETKWPPLAQTTVMLQGGPSGLTRQRTKPLEGWRQKVHSLIISDKSLWVGFADEIQKLAAIHHFGSGPYIIEPVMKKVLAALLPGGMRVSIIGPSGRTSEGRYLIFGKRVHHPGIPRRPLIPSDSLAQRLVVETVEAMLEKVSQDLK